jgi:hypothetical protein
MFVARGHVPPPVLDAPGMFALASDERIEEFLAIAGFTPVRIEDLEVCFVAESLAAYIAGARETGGLFARVWAEVSEAERESMTAELAEAFAPYESDGRYELPGVVVGIAAE